MSEKSNSDLSFLIVEDMPDQATLTKAFVLMEFPKAKILLASSLKEAHELLEKVKPNAVILDMHLGDGEGSELLKKYTEGRGFPILVLTADKSEAVLSEMMDLGADDFLFKPIDELIFQSKVRSLVSGRYVSPLSFLGNKKGLGSVQFDSNIKVVYMDDSFIRFQARYSLAKNSMLSLTINEATVEAKVRSSSVVPGQSDLYTIEVELEAPTAEASQKLRQFVFMQNGEKLAKYGQH